HFAIKLAAHSGNRRCMIRPDEILGAVGPAYGEGLYVRQTPGAGVPYVETRLDAPEIGAEAIPDLPVGARRPARGREHPRLRGGAKNISGRIKLIVESEIVGRRQPPTAKRPEHPPCRIQTRRNAHRLQHRITTKAFIWLAGNFFDNGAECEIARVAVIELRAGIVHKSAAER